MFQRLPYVLEIMDISSSSASASASSSSPPPSSSPYITLHPSIIHHSSSIIHHPSFLIHHSLSCSHNFSNTFPYVYLNMPITCLMTSRSMHPRIPSSARPRLCRPQPVLERQDVLQVVVHLLEIACLLEPWSTTTGWLEPWSHLRYHINNNMYIYSII